jgi:hypothetical protein
MNAQTAIIATTRWTHLVLSTRTSARLLSAIGVLALALISSGARADVVTEWNVVALETFKTANVGGNPLFRALAIMHVAMSDAVNTVQNRYTRYALDIPANAAASAESAATAAARSVLVALVPRKRPRWTRFTQRRSAPPRRGGKSRGDPHR